MPENYDHYISKNIKAFYKRRLAAPIIYLIVLMLAWHFFSLSAVFSPDILPDDTSLETAFRGGKQYISTTLSDLKFTGYTQSIFGHTNGYYYYTMRDEECIIVLLSPNTSEEGLPSIEEVTIKGKISKGNENFDTLLSNLSTDLNWTENGIRNKVSSYYISEPGFNHVGNWILFAAIFITGIYALLCIVLSVIYMFFPVLSPACQDLALFGNPKKMLEQAEEELATLPQLATEDMFITEHFSLKLPSTAMRSYRSMRSYGSTNTPRCTSFSGTISVSPTHCISVPTSICISSARRILNPTSTVSSITSRRQTMIFL